MKPARHRLTHRQRVTTRKAGLVKCRDNLRWRCVGLDLLIIRRGSRRRASRSTRPVRAERAGIQGASAADRANRVTITPRSTIMPIRHPISRGVAKPGEWPPAIPRRLPMYEAIMGNAKPPGRSNHPRSLLNRLTAAEEKAEAKLTGPSVQAEFIATTIKWWPGLHRHGLSGGRSHRW